MEVITVRPEDLQLPVSMPLPRRKNWGIGMVGFGEFAQRAHAPDYLHAGWKLAAVAVRNPAAQACARENFGIPHVYADYRDLIADETVEIVDVLTPPSVRAEVVTAAAEAGKHVIVEKPFGTTTEVCHRMVAATEKAGVVLAVHQNYRWMKGNLLAHHIVRNGLIGSPFFLLIEKFGNQDETRKDSAYAKIADYLTLHWNTHFVDLFRYWSGRNAQRVSTRTARSEVQNFFSDSLLISLHDFGGGLIGNIVHSELLRSSLTGDTCRIDGNEGSLVFDFAGTQIHLESRQLGNKLHRIDTSEMLWMEALCGSMGDALLAIEEGREPLVNGRDNLVTMNTVLAEMESAKSDGEWVNISD